MALDDLLSHFLGAGAGGGLLGASGDGMTGGGTLTNAPRSLTAPLTTSNVPGQGTSITDILGGGTDGPVGGGAMGGHQGSLGERLGGMASAGFADPTLANIARSIMTGLSIASPLAPLGLAEGAILSQTGLPGYASPILSAIASSLGLPGPISLKDFSGWGAFPADLVEQLSQATTPQQIAAIQAQMQHYAEQHGANAQLGGPFSGPAVQERATQRINDINAVLAGPHGFFGSPGGGGGGGGTLGVGGPSQSDPSGAHGTPGMGVG